MTKTNFYAICARGKNAEDGFYKVKAENFGEHINCALTDDLVQDIKFTLMRDFETLGRLKINISNRKYHASGGWHDEITHQLVAFVVEVNSHLPRAQISFDKEVKLYDSADNVGDESGNAAENEPKNSREYCENALKNEAQSKNTASVGASVQNPKDKEQELIDEDLSQNLKNQYNDTKNAQNNEKITGEALKDRLITKARKDSEALRAIYKKAKVDTTIYFEDEAGEIVSLWHERGDYEESGAIKALMMTKRPFVVVDLCESKHPLIRFCKGFKSEWLDENGEPIKDYK